MVCSAFQDMTVASGSGCTLRLFCICIYNWSRTPFLTEKKRCKQTRALLPSWSVLGVAAAAFTLSAALMCALLNRAWWTFFIKGTVCGLSFFSSLWATVWSTRVEYVSLWSSPHLHTNVYLFSHCCIHFVPICTWLCSLLSISISVGDKNLRIKSIYSWSM